MRSDKEEQDSTQNATKAPHQGAGFAVILKRIDAYERLMRLDKPVGILLLLWPTLWAFFLATRGELMPAMLWVFILGTVLMRSAGCIVNDIADRDFDRHVERTRARPLVTGEVSLAEAWLLCAVLLLCALTLAWTINSVLVWWLSLPALLIMASYPLAKRWLVLPQAHLGIAFSWGIPIAFAAVLETLPTVAWWLFAANFFWVIAYDTEYAMVDRPDDLKTGIKTSAIFFGRFDVAAVMLCYAAMLGIFGFAGYDLICRANWSMFYWLLGAILVAAVLMAHQYILIRGRDPQRCFLAFRLNHWIGLTILVGIWLTFGAH